MPQQWYPTIAFEISAENLDGWSARRRHVRISPGGVRWRWLQAQSIAPRPEYPVHFSMI
jgi:hypothetical protein